MSRKTTSSTPLQMLTELANAELPATVTTGFPVGGDDHKAVFTQLLVDGKITYLALLRNLTSIYEAGVDRAAIVKALRMGAAESGVLPLEFIAAAERAPKFDNVIDECMVASLAAMPKLEGKTTLLVDNSIGMFDTEIFIHRSTVTAAQAAQLLAVIAREVCTDLTIRVFSDDMKIIPATLRGIELAKTIQNAVPANGKNLNAAIKVVNEKDDYDRLIIVTDDQNREQVAPSKPDTVAYLMDVTAPDYDVTYFHYVEIFGFSDQLFRFIQILEAGG